MTDVNLNEKNECLSTQNQEEDYYKSKLFNAGYLSPRLIATSTLNDIAEKVEVNLNDAEKIIRWALQDLEESGVIPKCFSSAEDFKKKKNDQPKLATGCKSLDNMLCGGIELGVLTEFYGAPGVGKTQLCYNLSVMVQQAATVGGLEGKAIYIDTENKFSPDRMMEVAKARKFKLDRIFKNIIIVQPINVIHQERAIENIPAIVEKDSTIKLVVLDSIINHYRHEFAGRQNLSERQGRLEKSVRLLANTARLYDMAIVMTNQVSSSPDSFSIDPYVPVGGNVLAYASKHRISLRCIGRNIHAKIISSPSLTLLDARFTINESGVTDIK